MLEEQEAVVPNRFAVWAAISVVCAPLSLITFNPAAFHVYQRLSRAGYAAIAIASGESPLQFQEMDDSEREPFARTVYSGKPANPTIRVGDFTFSNTRIQSYGRPVSGIGYSGQLSAVYVDIKSQAKEVKIPAQVLSTELIDADGRSFNAVDSLIASSEVLDESLNSSLKPNKFTDAILPGATLKNVRVGVFDVTQGVQQLKLCIGDLLYPGKQCLLSRNL